VKGIRRPIGVALAACLLASCGVPAQDEPHLVELPRQPLVTAGPGIAGTAGTGEVAEVLCLVRDGRLVQVVRRLDQPPSLQLQVEHLLAGPSELERNTGLTTALVGMSLTVELSGGGEAHVGIAEGAEDTARSDEILAYGQIVCTLTSTAAVNSVVFTRGNERLEVPRADGSLSSGPLRGSDYATLIAPG
jgi:spore germination protein GerM